MVLEEKQRIIEELYVKMRKKVLGFCGRYIYDAHEREEIVQEIFINCFVNLDKFEFRSSLETWLYTISKNRCLNHIRYSMAKKRDCVKVQFEDFLGKSTPPVQIDSLAKDELDERLRVIYSKAEGLGKRDIECVMLVINDGLSYVEAGKKLGIPTNSVRSRVGRGRMLLRSKLKDMYMAS